MPDIGFVVYDGPRQSRWFTDTLFNTDDIRDADRDGFLGDEDCDESNPTVYPGAPQVCDGVDNTCSSVLPADEMDTDADSAINCADNCPSTGNASQADAEADGVGDACDNCPLDVNAMQVDGDDDGRGDACDCAPADVSTFALPSEVPNLRGTAGGIEWDSIAAGSGVGVTYDVIRGDLASLRNGWLSTEVCLQQGSTLTFAPDADVPLPGQGVFYLVRGANACGEATYGAGSAGGERTSLSCPLH